jgi:hypothetical protein
LHRAGWLISPDHSLHPATQALLHTRVGLLHIERTPEGREVQAMLQFLGTQGLRPLFEVLEQELRVCLTQLSTILSMAQFTSQVGAVVRSSEMVTP